MVAEGAEGEDEGEDGDGDGEREGDGEPGGEGGGEGNGPYVQACEEKAYPGESGQSPGQDVPGSDGQADVGSEQDAGQKGDGEPEQGHGVPLVRIAGCEGRVFS